MVAPGASKFRLTASVIASHFKHRCDRLFRWNVVANTDREKVGVGWNVPRRVRNHSRPGIALLMSAGDAFEIGRVQALAKEVALLPPVARLEPVVHHAGIESERGRQRVASLPLDDLLALLRRDTVPRFIAQLEIDLSHLRAVEAQFLHMFDLDPSTIELGVCRPDLLEVLPPDTDHPRPRLRVWDFKGSKVARHEHFMQVAFYTMLLEAVLSGLDVAGWEVDIEHGVIESRSERIVFDLAPYRLALSDFLRNRVPELLVLPAADAHFHVQSGCALCEYMDECRSRADAGDDLSRIPYITSESKRQLRAAGYRTTRELAALDAALHQTEITVLRGLSHDLSANIARYIAAAQALQDGVPRLLEQSTFSMPQYEDIRIVICAEQDAVTGTCFALGLKTYEGWDEQAKRPIGQEDVFIARSRDSETSILLPFLQVLNRLLERVHTENSAVRDLSPDSNPQVQAAEQRTIAAQRAYETFKEQHAGVMRKRTAHAAELRGKREQLKQEANAAAKALKEARNTFAFGQRRKMKRLHFYLYDTLDALALKALIERHLFVNESSALLNEIGNLVRLFPPESVLPDAETFRTIPATIMIQMLRALVALPIPYGYDLRTVSERYQPASGGFLFRTTYGFSWESSNQIAFERIHDVWNGSEFRYESRGVTRLLGPAEILAEIKRAVLAKLRATDAVVRRLKADLGPAGGLLLRKEPFQLYGVGEPLQVPQLEALRIFTALEVSLAELDVKRTHTLPVSDRVASFVCINGMRAESDMLDSEQALWFTFDPAAADTKFDPGDFNLVLTPADEPAVLLSEIDGDLFSNNSRWRYDPYRVTLKEFDFQAQPPRVRLMPDKPQAFLKKFDSRQDYVLDRLFVDFNSGKVFDVLRRLSTAEGSASHIQSLLAQGTIDGWSPPISDVAALEATFRSCLTAAGSTPDQVLNAGQWHAWRGVLHEPLTLLWGPPGTGKTHTIAHMLIGYAMAAQLLGRPLRVLVSAFTHHAIDNVLIKITQLAQRYHINTSVLQIHKMQRSSPAETNTGSALQVALLDPEGLEAALQGDSCCMVVGATVWAVHRAMATVGDVIQPWFDLVLIDEASQMKLPDALIAFSASKAVSQIILAGDDRQLPPIIHGVYPQEHEHLLTSVFAFVRDRIERQRDTHPDLEARILFQLEENFRMNDPLTAYPRDALYNGRFVATKPDIRISITTPLAASSDDLLAFLLHPDRPVLLVRYRPPRSFTARNPLEAGIAAALVAQLRDLLIDQRTGLLYSQQAFAHEGVAVLSPHRAQNSTIRQVLHSYGFGTGTQPMPLVDTVDKLQGQERDVVVVSYGVADSEYAEGEAEFLLSSNRFNVAATRARHKLIVLCADPVLDVVPTDQRILLDAMMLKQFRRYCDQGPRVFDWTGDGEIPVSLLVQWKEFPS